jgi:nitrogenase molybdenum-iron protein alpha/beta subunit
VTARDEAFWRQQELRREKQMGQPCCTQSGMSWTMIDMPGNFAVVIHGEQDCVNCFHHHTGRSAVQYYSTRLTEEMITTGRTEAALRELLTLIAREQKPDVVMVLGTCPVEVIGDQFSPVVKDMSARTGIPMIPLRTSGLALSSQQQMLDWLFKTLASLPERPPVDRYWQRQVALLSMAALFEAHAGEGDAQGALGLLRGLADAAPDPAARVNFVGIPSRPGTVPEPVVLLGEAGVEVNGCFPEGASVREWAAIRHARHAFVVDTGMYPRLIEVLGQTHGQAIHEIPLPVGIGPTLRMYEAIGQATGRAEVVSALIAPLAASMRAVGERFRAAHAGRKVAVTIRMLANYDLGNLAYDGLGEVEALTELGLDVGLFIQGPPEDSARAVFAEHLRQRGWTGPFEIFGGPWILPQMLRDGGYHLAITSDAIRAETKEVGVPLLATRSLAPYLGGVPDNVEILERVLREPGRGR